MARAALLQHLTIGQIRITYLPDGYAFFNPTAIFPTSTAADWQRYRHLLNEDGLLVASLGAHIIQTPDYTVLVDTSQGPRHLEDKIMTLHGGELLDSLKQAGFEPTDIDVVFYTHLHIDHVGWTGRIIDEKHILTFPRARHLVRSAEWQRFADPATSRSGVDEALKLLESHIQFVEHEQSVVPGVTVLATSGHTAGHSALIVTVGSERAIILGDTFHSTVLFEYPEWVNTFDSDTELARVTRLRMIEELAKPATYGVGTHFADIIWGRYVHGQWVELDSSDTV